MVYAIGGYDFFNNFHFSLRMKLSFELLTTIAYAWLKNSLSNICDHYTSATDIFQVNK